MIDWSQLLRERLDSYLQAGDLGRAAQSLRCLANVLDAFDALDHQMDLGLKTYFKEKEDDGSQSSSK